MTDLQLIQHRNNEIARLEAIILDLTLLNKGFEIKLIEKDMEIYKLHAEIFNLNSEKL